jgi:hypothetical protein
VAHDGLQHMGKGCVVKKEGGVVKMERGVVIIKGGVVKIEGVCGEKSNVFFRLQQSSSLCSNVAGSSQGGGRRC